MFRLVRLVLGRRLRWLAVGAVVRFLARRGASRQVDEATRDLEQRLPPTVGRALEALPAELTRAAGSVIVAGRTARQVADTTKRASATVSDGRRRVGEAAERGRRRLNGPFELVKEFRDEVDDRSRSSARDLRADYLRATEGNAAADDALLDLRSDGQGIVAQDVPPPLVDPVRSGRWRADRRDRPLVERVQRTYRRPSTPWE